MPLHKRHSPFFLFLTCSIVRWETQCAVLQTAAEISKTAIDNSDQLAVEAVDLFLALIGAEAGHMGLRSLASGGIYICGGIMPKVSQHSWTIVTNIYAHMGSPRS